MSNALTSRFKKKKKGFTLIELIIVIAIIAILGAIAIPSFTTIRENSKKKSDEASAETIKRTVITLITDGTIKKGTADATFTITGSTVGVPSGFGAGSADATTLGTYFKEVNLPQQSGATHYLVTVKSDETVTVTATP